VGAVRNVLGRDKTEIRPEGGHITSRDSARQGTVLIDLQDQKSGMTISGFGLDRLGEAFLAFILSNPVILASCRKVFSIKSRLLASISRWT
jgi:hypothetical protein